MPQPTFESGQRQDQTSRKTCNKSSNRRNAESKDRKLARLNFESLNPKIITHESCIPRHHATRFGSVVSRWPNQSGSHSR